MRGLRKKLRIQNIYHYIIIFSVMVMLIITIMGSYLYRFYYKTIYEGFCTENESKLNVVMSQHENDMQIMMDIVSQIELSTDTTKFFLSQQPLKSRDIKDRLSLYTEVSQFFGQIYYYYQEDKYLYNHATSVSIDLFVDCFRLEEMSAEEFQKFLGTEIRKMIVLPEQKISGEFMFNYMSNDAAVLYLMPLGPKYDEVLMFVVGNDYYDRILEFKEGNSYIIYEDEVIVSRGHIAVSEEQLLSALPDGNVQEQITIDGEKFLLTTEKGNNKLVYVTLQPMENFYNRMLSGQWGILALLLVCCIPTAFVILMGGKRLTGWFRHMNSLLNREPSDAYNMEDMKSDVQNLINAEQESKAMRKSVFVRNFIRSDYSSKQDVVEAAKAVGMNANYKFFAAAIVHQPEDVRENKAFGAILSAMEKENDLEGYGAHLVNNNRNLLVLFADKKETIARMMDKIFLIGRSECESFIMAVSFYHEDFVNGSMAYVEAVTAFDNRYLVDNSRIIYYSDVVQPVNCEIIPSVTQQNLKNALKTGNGEAAKGIILEICERMKKERPSMFTFRLCYDDIFRIILSEWSGAEDGWKQIYNVFTLSRCQSIEDFNELLTEACSMILESKTDVKTQQTSMAENAMRYMNEHFQDMDLNMSMLAEYLQISSVTLAVEFKNEMGVSPSDYLASLRMERAKKLLRETDLLIREISQAVGYEDDHVFMRRFKKYTGKTPGQYRKEG